MRFFTFSFFKDYYFAPIASASGYVKSDVSQSEVMFHNDVGFIAGYTVCLLITEVKNTSSDPGSFIAMFLPQYLNDCVCYYCIVSGNYRIYIHVITGLERTVHVSRCPALYSGRIFVPLCRELIIFVF